MVNFSFLSLLLRSSEIQKLGSLRCILKVLSVPGLSYTGQGPAHGENFTPRALGELVLLTQGWAASCWVSREPAVTEPRWRWAVGTVCAALNDRWPPVLYKRDRGEENHCTRP